MKESGYYPAGAEFDPNAPWNEKEPKARTFHVYVEQTLAKRDKISSSDYTEEIEQDELGRKSLFIDMSNMDLENEWKMQHLPLPFLLAELKSMCEAELKNPSTTKARYALLEKIICECEGWEAGGLFVDGY